MKNLKKPLACLDIETTGLNTQVDKIIEIFILKLNIDGTLEEFYSRFNPWPTPIGEGAFGKHGISQEDLQNEPIFKDKIPEIQEFLENCDIVGYNIIKFDIPMIIDEFIRNGVVFNHRGRKIYDAYKIWTHFEKRTLSDAVVRFLDQKIKDYHTAKSDVEHTLNVFQKQVDLFGDQDLDAFDELSNFSKTIDFNGMFVLNDSFEIMFGQGKHQGKLVKDIVKTEKSYMDWIIEKSQMPNETKLIAKKLKIKFA